MFIGPLQVAIGGRLAVSRAGVQKKISMARMELPSRRPVMAKRRWKCWGELMPHPCRRSGLAQSQRQAVLQIQNPACRGQTDTEFLRLQRFGDVVVGPRLH